MFDYSKLIGKIIEKYGSRKAFAKAYGISENTMCNKLKGNMRFTTDDIVKMSSKDFLDIPSEELHIYFFTHKVQNLEPKGEINE